MGYCCDSYCYSNSCSSTCCNSYGTCANSYSNCSSYYRYSYYSGYTYYTNYDSLVNILVGSLVGVQALAALIFFICWIVKRRHRLSKLNNLGMVGANISMT